MPKQRGYGVGEVLRPSGNHKSYRFRYYDQTGRRIYESLNTTDRREAHRRADERRSILSARAASHRHLRVSDLERLVEADYRRKKRRSLEDLPYKFRPLVQHFGEMPIEDITLTHVDAYIADRSKQKAFRSTRTISTNTINRELSALARGLKLAHRRGFLTKALFIEKLPATPPRSGFVTDDQLDQILAHLQPQFVNPIRFAYESAWRFASEVLTRKWSHVDFNERVIRIDPGESKTGKAREVGWWDELEAILLEQRMLADRVEAETGVPVTYVFFHHTGGQGRIRGGQLHSYNKMWKDACKAAGLPHILVHDLRRSGVRNMIMDGLSFAEAMAISGHETISVFQNYNIKELDMMRHAAKKRNSRRQDDLPAHSAATIAEVEALLRKVLKEGRDTSHEMSA